MVVSGLARGIDAAAHRGALEAGTTVAVLGCGIDRDYPRAHAALAAQIAASGLIVSEYAPGVEPAPWRFPARNRIVAGLARATVVVEARERSGALITADLALDEGREVLAVPGEITAALSKGTNALLRLGATPVTCVADVLEAIGVEPAPPIARAGARRPGGSRARRDRRRAGPGRRADPSHGARRGRARSGARRAGAARARRPDRRPVSGGDGPDVVSAVVSTTSYWLEEPREPLPQRRFEGRAEVAVIGGGVTGCSCALTLAERGVRVRLHEAREVAGGASGRNGGFALRGATPPYDEARRLLGAERARP